MDNRPIGFFDSGLGGLTCISPILYEMPQERIIYFGDTARTPYGSKSTDTIKTFSLQIADFLIKSDVKMIVIACNTVSAICLEDIQNTYPHIPVIGIIDPAARIIAKMCDEGKEIGLIGTKATIKSRAYEKIIEKFSPTASIHSMACPVFVPLIEEGIIENEIMDLSIKHYMDHFINYHGIDTLVLGCTHYPLIRSNINKLYPHLEIIDPSTEVASHVYNILSEKNMLTENSSFENTFYASDLSENFINMINKIFEINEFSVVFKNLDL